MPLAPQIAISEAECEAGLRRVITEAAYSSATTALTSGVILTAFALYLGASNLVIGIMASAPFLSQLLQAPAVLLIEKLRERKRIAVLSSIIGRSMLAVMGFAALLPPPLALAAIAMGQIVLCSMSAFGSCAWNAWLRDLAPEGRLGQVFARRTTWATAVSLIAGVAAAVVLDRTAAGSSGRAIAFAALYTVACIAGLISAAIVARIPEPVMKERAEGALNLGALLREPLHDRNFRRLMIFLSSWQFAVNLATPFFTVFLVRQLGYSMTFVMILTVVSQLSNLAALRNWGTLSDRFTNKSVLLVAAPTYIVCIVAMIGASQIDHRETLTAYLVLLHLAMGAAVAGVTLATTNIALKLSPKGSATAYVATSALATSAAAGLAPIIGGAFADFFSARRLELLLRWTSPDGVVLLSPLRLSHWDFYFLTAGILGLFALHRLSLVREKGEIERREMIEQLLHQTRRSVRNLSTVAGLRALTEIPATLVRDAHVRLRFTRKRRQRAST
ncbi:MFS transporter [Sphingomonas sp. SRS2]|uniref:MFS transporter n=1 Tax=Sphingomonas sp. SRS2 TaxID=133190 RepID=UPI0006962B2E|nr:MFS transporter [Sphingomonas sp. SRS2]